ncbi:MAG: hypothetical protein V4587_00430 [Acidobacteriota bacterium]
MALRKYTLQIDPFLESRSEWHVSMSEEPDPEFTFVLRFPPHWALPLEKGATPFDMAKRGWTFKEADVFDVRAVVFAIKSPSDALECFRRFGPWRLPERLATKADPIKWSQLQLEREFYEDALLHRSVENLNRTYEGEELIEGIQNMYLWQPLPAELLFSAPYIEIVRCWDLQTALRASIFLDRMEGFIWRRCARKDCETLYKVSSKRQRLYCKTYCAHLANLRAKRNALRKAADVPTKKAARKAKPKR